jgi:hypothetical protein
MIGMVETRVERNGTVARERRYYLSSTTLDAKTFAAADRIVTRRLRKLARQGEAVSRLPAANPDDVAGHHRGVEAVRPRG